MLLLLHKSVRDLMYTKVLLAALLILAPMAGCLERTTVWPEPYRDDCDRGWIPTNKTREDNTSNNTTLEAERLWYQENCPWIDYPDDTNATNSTEREEEDTSRSDPNR